MKNFRKCFLKRDQQLAGHCEYWHGGSIFYLEETPSLSYYKNAVNMRNIETVGCLTAALVSTRHPKANERGKIYLGCVFVVPHIIQARDNGDCNRASSYCILIRESDPFEILSELKCNWNLVLPAGVTLCVPDAYHQVIKPGVLVKRKNAVRCENVN